MMLRSISARFSPRTFALQLFLLCAISTAAFGWGSTGHRIINQKAVYNLPPSMSAYIADSVFIYQHASDADNRKVSGDTSFWNEGQRHFIDIDWYPNFHSLPHSLDSMIALYGRSRIVSEGTNPWATMMFLDSLTAQLQRGDNASAQQTMADLGHYVGDAHQPLHCANNYDGQLSGNNGIHSRYESSMISTYQSSIILHADSIHYLSRPLDYIFDYIYHANSYVDTIMAADNYAKSVSGWSGSGSAPASYYSALWSKCSAFTIDQFQRATVDLASLWYTAWMNSVGTPISYDTILAHVVGSGTILPAGTVVILTGADQHFSITPTTGYHVDSLYVDAAKVDSLTSYTFPAVSSYHTIDAYFSINHYTLTASSGVNGSIAPSGTVSVSYGDNQTFVIAPVTGYHVDTLLVDAVNQPYTGNVTFNSISANHSVAVTFALNHYALTATAGSHGSIAPSGSLQIAYSDSQLFTIHPDSGYFVDSVIVDGVFVGTDSSYMFHAISQPHSIAVVFSNGSVERTFAVSDNWNLVSVPVTPNDPSLAALFPAASSAAFSYDGAYSPQSSLAPRLGYWLKFSGGQSVSLTGKPILADTLPVVEGWNLIGSISVPVPVSGIQTIPGGMIASSFFEYQQGYRTTDTIRSGYGYWVKVDQAGSIILSQNAGPVAARIHVVPNGEMPPAAPAGAEAEREIPRVFALGAYPNPFNPSTTIRLDLPVGSTVSLRLYSSLGQEVKILMEGFHEAGSYDVHVNGGDLASGTYFYRVIAGGFVRTEKILLLK